MKVGISVYCTTCQRQKKPRGRCAPLEISDSLCDHECEGYLDDPKPGELWTGETEADAGLWSPASDSATTEVQ